MKNVSLFEVTSTYNNALAAMYDMEVDGLIDTQTFLDTMEGLEGELTEKATNVAAYIRNKLATAAQIDDAAKEMAKRSSALKKHALSLQEYLLINMLEVGINEINCPWFDLKVKKTPAAVKIVVGTELPSEFMTVKTTEAPNKTALKAAIKDGQEIDGVSLVSGQRLEIK
jgi:hypothetical protein